ncbi:MAG TPA: hypothetical protein VFO54_07765 [Chryseosolibacter sp.]|nr:hypothetical protein [Chryseosolibacter sp.]
MCSFYFNTKVDVLVLLLRNLGHMDHVFDTLHLKFFTMTLAELSQLWIEALALPPFLTHDEKH